MSSQRISIEELCERVGLTEEEVGSLCASGVFPPVQEHRVHGGPNAGRYRFLHRPAVERGLQTIVTEHERPPGEII